MSSTIPAHVAATTETDFQSFSAVVLKPLLQFISTECLASFPASSLEIADFVIQLLTANKELVNQLCRGGKTSIRLEKPNPPSVSYSESLLRCKAAVFNALKRRDISFLRNVFNRHKDVSGGLAGQNLIQALQEVDAPTIPTSDQEAEDIIKQFDANSNKTLEFGEFQQVVYETDELQAWFHEKQLSIAADALRPLVGRGSDQLKKLSQLSPADIEHAAAVTCSIIPGMLQELHQELQAAFDVQSQIEADMKADPSKFNDFYKMACGTITDFHKGLTGRVGMPHLDFKNAMRQEHCERAGCDVQFTTGNYKITTTPSQEWQYIVESVPCPNMGHERRIIPISELLQLDSSKAAKLCEEEVIAIVLYTGPMFQIYNTILRQYPEDKFAVFRDGDNLFSTTIFVLVSAVQKLSRCTRIPLGTQLYRGLGGKVELPDTFFQIDDKGCSGYAEWGFLSTTSDRDVALGYSGVKERRPKAMVMIIETSSIDRGADISNYSQYPGEKEFLFLPCSFVQRSRQGGGRVEVVLGGLMAFVSVRVNLNIKTQTVDELLEQRKSLHMVSAKSILAEVKFELTESLGFLKRSSLDGTCFSDFSIDSIRRCEQLVRKHDLCDASDFGNDILFRSMVNEVFDFRDQFLHEKAFQLHRYILSATCVATLEGHSNAIFSVAFHPTAPLLATSSDDKTVRLWRLSSVNSSATCVATFEGHSKDCEVFCSSPYLFAFHPTMPLMANCSGDNTVKLWLLSCDNSPATCVATLEGNNYEVVAFHPTAPLLATGSDDKTVRLWRLSSDNSSATCVATLEDAFNCVFHPTGLLLATNAAAFEQNDCFTVKLWQLSSDNSSTTCVATLKNASLGIVAFHPTMPLMATNFHNGEGEGTVKLWRLSTDNSSATCVANLVVSNDFVCSVAFHPRAPLLATCFYDVIGDNRSNNIVRLWRLSSDYSSATCEATLDGHSYGVRCVAFHPTAPLLATCSDDKTVKLWR
jgi:WD40 repeat protein